MDLFVGPDATALLLLVGTLAWAWCDRGHAPTRRRATPHAASTGAPPRSRRPATTPDPDRGLAARLRWLRDEIPAGHPARAHLDAALAAAERAVTVPQPGEDRLVEQLVARPRTLGVQPSEDGAEGARTEA